MSTAPILHILAGPNGAGKSTLYQEQLRPIYPKVEFVNADELARQRFGHPAETLEESKVGQELAENRRRELMASRKGLITETTFSHPSKLDLIADAKALGYQVRVYHVNVRSPYVSIQRVAKRVEQGGHQVPEEKIRERYVRNQSLIRQAVLQSDKAVVFDNSRLDNRAAQTIVFHAGQVVWVSDSVPAWARDIYSDSLKGYSLESLNPRASSFTKAKALAVEKLASPCKLYIAEPGARYSGEVLGHTAFHSVQKVREGVAVAHFIDKLEKLPDAGCEITVEYPREPSKKALILSTDSLFIEGEQVKKIRTLSNTLGDSDKRVAHALLEALRDGQKNMVRDLLRSSANVRRLVSGIMEKDLGAVSKKEPRSR